MCECFAHCEADCVCDHDWTPPELTAARERIAVLEAERDQLRAELAEVKRDAERYRWLRYPRMGWDIVRKTDGELLCAEYLDGIELDAAIDASRKGEGE